MVQLIFGHEARIFITKQFKMQLSMRQNVYIQEFQEHNMNPHSNDLLLNCLVEKGPLALVIVRLARLY